MDDFELEIKNDFINEALLNLEESESAFMELESSSETAPLLDQIFRLAHNLKGGSRAVGFGDVAEFTHELENLVLKIQKNEVTLSSPVVTTLLKSNDRLIEMLNALKADLNAVCDNKELIAEIKSWIECGGAAASSPQPETESSHDALAAEPVLAVEEPMVATDAADKVNLALVPDAAQFGFEAADSVEGPAESEVPLVEVPTPPTSVVSERPVVEQQQKSSEKEDEVVRVHLSKINMLNDLVGELIVTQSMVQQESISGNALKLQASIQQMTKLSKDIQSIAMGLRMLPVKPLVQKLQRVVRDTANALGKSVQLELEGEGIDVDKSVLDRLADPLIHILRNAVDHGLESSEERSQSSKPAQGSVKLGFANEGNYLVISIQDDGKGIDAEFLKRKAIEKGLITSAQNLTEKQLLNLVFHPGFSTKEQTSEISGRGVGMDVVKTNIEKIGGKVDLSTELGTGTRFEIKIPLSLAVIEGLVVKSQSGRYIVPLSQVQETINLDGQHVHRDKLGIGDCIELRSHVVPLLRLDHLMGSKVSKAGTEAGNSTALIFDINNQLVAMVVDEVIRSQQVVIKPLGNGISQKKGWVGTCVLGDGLPSLIINPADLLINSISSQRGAA